MSIRSQAEVPKGRHHTSVDGSARLRVLLVAQRFWPELGGAEVQTRRLAEEWVRQGCEVTVTTCRWSPEQPASEEIAGVRIHREPFPNVRFLGTAWYVARLARWIRTRVDRFDVVCVCMLKHAAYAAIRGAGDRLPVVLQACGAGRTGDVAWGRSAVLGRRLVRTFRRADAIVSPAPAITDELSEAGYAKEQIAPIPNGIPIPLEPYDHAQKSTRRERLGFDEAKTVCYVGRLSPEKGVADLVTAMTFLPEHRLVLVGDGPQRSDLERLVVEHGTRNRVRFVGRVDDPEPYLHASDVFVLPSYQEGQSLALLEALAVGVPVVASDIPPNHGIVADPLLSFAPAGEPRALAEAIRQRKYTLQDALEARRQVTERYGISAVATAYLDLFRRLRASRAIACQQPVG